MFTKISLILFVAALAVGVSAQAVHTPEKRSPERKAILDALRLPVERDLKQKVVFVADHFSVQGTWAFVSGAPQNSTGGEPDYSETKYADQYDTGAFDNNFFALLRKTGGKWKVTHYLIGCTDVCYLDWWSRYKAPKAIFPHTE